MLLIYFCLNLIFQNVKCSENILNVGGIFEEIQLHQTAFLYSNKVLNDNKTTTGIRLSPLVNSDIKANNAFSALKGTCTFLHEGVVGIFGPQSPSNLDIVQSISDRTELPHILTRWVNPSQMGRQSINFFPSPSLVADAFLDIIRVLEWTTFTIIYTESESLLKLNEFIMKSREADIFVYVKHLGHSLEENYRPTLQGLGQSGQKNYVLDCPIQNLKEILLQIQQVGMLTNDYNYFLTNLDAYTEDLEPFMHSEASITGVHLVKPDDEQTNRVRDDLCHLYKETFNQECRTNSQNDYKLDFETALIIDAVHTFSGVLRSMEVTKGEILDCNMDGSWTDGLSVINILKSGSYKGLTGTIEFGSDGFRNVFELTIFQLKKQFMVKGNWKTSEGINITLDDFPADRDNLYSKNLIVEITLIEPYAMLKESLDHLEGNDRFEGFVIDLIEEISKMEGFTYIFVVREDRKHGVFDSLAGKWTGMVGDILEGKADLAVSDLTITSDRADPIEFTLPFMTLGISILYRKPIKKVAHFFHFAQPFSAELWKSLVVSVVLVALSLLITGRLCQSEWEPHRSRKNNKKFLVNRLTFHNSLWFVVGSLFRQNTKVSINSIPGRIISASWWLFCFVTVAMYIAYSTANSTIEEKETLFNNAEELMENAENLGIKFGAVNGGATQAFFKRSRDPVYQEIAHYMEEHPEEMAILTREGIERAERENYAFFMESATIEYAIQRHCSLSMYGGLLDNKGFGIAVKKGSVYLTSLNKAILKLQTSGELERIKRKWWEGYNIDHQCQVESDPEPAPKELAHINGLLWITVIGISLATLSAVLEFAIHSYHLSKKVKITYRQTFIQEMKRCFTGKTKLAVNPALLSKSEDEAKPSPETVELL